MSSPLSAIVLSSLNVLPIIYSPSNLFNYFLTPQIQETVCGFLTTFFLPPCASSSRSVLSPDVKRAISLTSTMFQLRSNLVFHVHKHIIPFLSTPKPTDRCLLLSSLMVLSIMASLFSFWRRSILRRMATLGSQFPPCFVFAVDRAPFALRFHGEASLHREGMFCI